MSRKIAQCESPLVKTVSPSFSAAACTVCLASPWRHKSIDSTSVVIPPSIDSRRLSSEQSTELSCGTLVHITNLANVRAITSSPEATSQCFGSSCLHSSALLSSRVALSVALRHDIDCLPFCKSGRGCKNTSRFFWLVDLISRPALVSLSQPRSAFSIVSVSTRILLAPICCRAMESVILPSRRRHGINSFSLSLFPSFFLSLFSFTLFFLVTTRIRR